VSWQFCWRNDKGLRSIDEMIDGGTATKTSIPSPTPIAARLLVGMVPYVAPDDVELLDVVAWSKDRGHPPIYDLSGSGTGR
jgi:hypothetical protein